jgi:hypothetical protein
LSSWAQTGGVRGARRDHAERAVGEFKRGYRGVFDLDIEANPTTFRLFGPDEVTMPSWPKPCPHSA